MANRGFLSDSFEEKTTSFASYIDGVRCRLLVLCKVGLSAFDLFVPLVIFCLTSVMVGHLEPSSYVCWGGHHFFLFCVLHFTSLPSYLSVTKHACSCLVSATFQLTPRSSSIRCLSAEQVGCSRKGLVVHCFCSKRACVIPLGINAGLWCIYFASMELSAALHPLPEHVLPFFIDVLRDVHPALAAPFVKASL